MNTVSHMLATHACITVTVKVQAFFHTYSSSHREIISNTLTHPHQLLVCTHAHTHSIHSDGSQITQTFSHAHTHTQTHTHPPTHPVWRRSAWCDLCVSCLCRAAGGEPAAARSAHPPRAGVPLLQGAAAPHVPPAPHLAVAHHDHRAGERAHTMWI